VFYTADGQPLLDEKIIGAFSDLVEKEGTGIWFSSSADELAARLGLPAGLTKGRDTLDVWIDSGTSWAAVTGKSPELAPAPADLYLEGSDQHRGWFQSSLLTSVAATGKAPYRAVLTNGFVVDEERKKLSKSNEGYQKPVDLMSLVNEHGADVLRLWVSSQNYQDDIPFSHDIFARVSDAYRSIRNTLRILLGNLHDFDPRKNLVPATEWTGLDEYLFLRFRHVASSAVTAYGQYDFAQVYQALNRFCAVELSSLYVDVLKDRLYCNAANDRARRTAQSAMFFIYIELTKLLAPIIPFTAEEAWQLKGEGQISVHLTPLPKHAPRDTDAALEARWKTLLEVRSRVNEKLEAARRDKVIGKSLEARVEIATTALPDLPTSELEELFIVSKVVLTKTAEGETITVTKAGDSGMKKCVRCWKYWDHIGTHAEHPELCDRCTQVALNFGL
jgi:isoleucyl-tRNA synthetase